MNPLFDHLMEKVKKADIRRKQETVRARPIDCGRSKYMPHQGKQECARRVAKCPN